MQQRHLYNRVALLRRDKGLTRQQLADVLGVNVQTVGYLEREDYNPSLDLALRISEVLGLPIEMIFSASPMKSLKEELLERRMKEVDREA